MKNIVVISTYLLILVLATIGQVYASEVYIIVVGDSCGYEVARTVIEEYGYLARVIPYSMLTEIPSNAVLVVLFTNVTSREAFDHVLNFIEKYNVSVIVTDVFLEYASPRADVRVIRVVLNEDLWQYCVYSDKFALERVESALRLKTQVSLLPVVAALVALAVATSLQIHPEAKDRVQSILRKLAIPLIGLFSLLHMKIKKEDIFSHPVRQDILRILLTRGEVSFAELQKELGCSRATLEWHISLLIRARVIEELKVGRKRVFRLNSFTPIPRSTAERTR